MTEQDVDAAAAEHGLKVERDDGGIFLVRSDPDATRTIRVRTDADPVGLPLAEALLYLQG